MARAPLGIGIELVRSTHPAPAAFVTVITVVLGVAIGLSPATLAVLAVAIASNQLSVGLSNDWLDAARDREAGRTDKPVAAGRIGVRTVRTAAIVALGVSLAAAAALGPGVLAADAVFLLAAWAYNAGLKATPLSLGTYLLGFGALPWLPALAAAPPQAPAPWAVIAGALLGGAAHFANVLPDLDDDLRHGVRGLPQRMGRGWSIVAAAGLLLAASTVIVVGAEAGPVLLVGLFLVGALVVALILTARRADGSRTPFLLVMSAALVTVLMLLSAGGRLLG